tara:strand:- start:2888 stop:3907 length:1020 start_codon:yes stop_codon:yes gene_type:complete
MKKTVSIESVSNAAVKDLVESCNSLGILNDDLADLAINPETLNDPLLRFSEKKLLELWHAIAAKSDRPDIGLLIGNTINPSAKGLLASWVSQAESLAEAIEIFRSNIVLMNPSEHWDIQADHKLCTLTFAFDKHKPYPSIAIERSMTAMVSWGRALSGHAFPIVEANFTFPCPAYHDEFTAIFGNNIQFNMPENTLKFESKLLQLPIVSGNQYLKSLIEEKAKSSLQTLTKVSSFSAKTKAAIAEILIKKGSISIDAVCTELATSRQTLYRKLKEEGSDYKSLSEAYKKTEALRLLQNETENITSVSLRLGYKDTSSFYKAFQRWYGMSPKFYLDTMKH